MAVVGYYSASVGGGHAAMEDEIIAAGHTPVAISDPTAANLAGIDTLYVWNASNSGWGSEIQNASGDISTAVQNGMNLVVFDRAIGNADPDTILPGATGIVDVRSTTRDVDFTTSGASSIGSGPGGSISNTSLDGKSFTVHGYVQTSSLPSGSTVLMTEAGDPSKAVGFEYDFGAGSVMYFGMPLDAFSYGNDANWEGFASNTLHHACVCFLQGTLIETPTGSVPIETLRPGDLVETLDDGPQPVRWVGHSLFDPRPDDAPICVPQGVLDATRPLFVSPNHALLFEGLAVETLFGTSEVLVRAQHLLGHSPLHRITCRDHTYFHLLFDRHQIITASGVRSESLFLGPQTRLSIGAQGRRETHSIARGLPEFDHDRTARPVLKQFEVSVLMDKSANLRGTRFRSCPGSSLAITELETRP